MWHHAEEQWLLTSYRACAECMHVFQSAEELVEAYNRGVEEHGITPIHEADLIYFCPLCTHDW